MKFRTVYVFHFSSQTKMIIFYIKTILIHLKLGTSISCVSRSEKTVYFQKCKRKF
eukprot:GAHX01003870.1.p1 GENE.GAHX01003870.1~~GAHX01003870.1.p1  ORF type:complete len:55 (-),score=1.91 GAHX01003870.1:3-167(-)